LPGEPSGHDVVALEMDAARTRLVRAQRPDHPCRRRVPESQQPIAARGDNDFAGRVKGGIEQIRGVLEVSFQRAARSGIPEPSRTIRACGQDLAIVSNELRREHYRLVRIELCEDAVLLDIAKDNWVQLRAGSDRQQAVTV